MATPHEICFEVLLLQLHRETSRSSLKRTKLKLPAHPNGTVQHQYVIAFTGACGNLQVKQVLWLIKFRVGGWCSYYCLGVLLEDSKPSLKVSSCRGLWPRCASLCDLRKTSDSWIRRLEFPNLGTLGTLFLRQLSSFVEEFWVRGEISSQNAVQDYTTYLCNWNVNMTNRRWQLCSGAHKLPVPNHRQSYCASDIILAAKGPNAEVAGRHVDVKARTFRCQVQSVWNIEINLLVL